MDTYKAKWKRKSWFCLGKVEKNLIGHSLDREQNKMIFFYKDGSVKEIVDWKNCAITLGTDWVLWTKTQMEKQAGQPISLAVQPK